jgi:hypothetical protein
MRMKTSKKGASNFMFQVIVHLILVGLIFAIFFLSASSRANSQNTRRQVIEKQLALLIESGEPGMTFSLTKINMNGKIERIEIKNDEKGARIYAYPTGVSVSKGYQFFSRYNVGVSEDEYKFYIKITEK